MSKSLNTSTTSNSFINDSVSTILEKPFSWDTSKARDTKKEEINYNLISYISNKKKPDIYIGDKVIYAKHYKVYDSVNEVPKEEVRKKKNENSEETQELIQPLKKSEEEKKTNDETDHSSDPEGDYADLKRKEMRYFNTTSNITIKCYNCDEVGHMARNCPNEMRVVCNRCNMPGHFESDCNIMKCFKCHKPGHKFTECTVDEKAIIKCDGCKSIGHRADSCLSNPKKINKNPNINCRFCDGNHLICPLFVKNNEDIISDYNSENEEISENESHINDNSSVEIIEERNLNKEEVKRGKIKSEIQIRKSF